MKAVIVYALIGALAVGVVLPGCSTVEKPDVQDAADAVAEARALLGKTLAYADNARLAAEIVCSIDKFGEPCRKLVLLLDGFYARAVAVEIALNAGEATLQDLREIEALAEALWQKAEAVLRSLT